MKIYIDVSELSKVNFVSGIQRVVIEVVTRWINCDYDVCLLSFNEKKRAFFVIDNDKFVEYYTKHLNKKQFITKKEMQISEFGSGDVFFDIDSVWMNSLKRSYLLPILKSQSVTLVSHIYDIIPITEPQYCHELTVLHFMDYLGAHIENSDLIIANANATIDAIRKVDAHGIGKYDSRVVKLGSNLKSRKEELTVSGKIQDIVASGTYILMVGTMEPRKNHKFILEAFEKELFDKDVHLVFAGRLGWNMESFMEIIKHHPQLGKKFFYIGGASDDEILYLYEHAFFVAFASYNEGFGLPIIESFANGTPVLAADIPVLRETGGDYCDYFSLDDSQEFIDKVNYYLSDSNAYQEKKKLIREYTAVSWDESAKEMYDAIASL